MNEWQKKHQELMQIKQMRKYIQNVNLEVMNKPFYLKRKKENNWIAKKKKTALN